MNFERAYRGEAAMTQGKRAFWRGAMIAPLSVPVVYGLWALFFWHDPTPKEEFSDFSSSTIFAWLFAMATLTLLSYIVTWMIGFPLIVTLKRLRRLSFQRVVISSAFISAAVFGVLLLPLLALSSKAPDEIWSLLTRVAGMGTIAGTLVSTTFCFSAGIRPVLKEVRSE